MSDPRIEPEPSPATRSRKYRRRTLILGLIAILVAMEFVLSGLIVGVAAITGRSYRGISEQLFATRLLISPFIGRHPIEHLTGARSLGHYTGRNSKDFYPADSLLGWRLGKNVAIVDLLNEYMAGITDIRPDGNPVENWRFTNDQGFMTAGELRFHYAIPKPGNVFRIIVVGGSTVEGYGADGYKNNLPAQLASKLNRLAAERRLDGFEKFEVINAGVGAYHSAIEYLYLVSDLMDYAPDVVIAYDGNNDAIGGNFAISAGGSPFKTETHMENTRRINASYHLVGSARMFFENIAQEAVRFSGRFSGGFALLKAIEYAGIWLSPDTRPIHHIQAPPFYPQTVDIYKNNVERMALLGRQYGFKFAGILQPALGIDNKEYIGREKYIFDLNAGLVDMKKKFYAGAREAFRSLRLKFASDSKVCIADISGTVFADVKERVYTDNVHLLGAGNSRVADAILNELDRCGFLPLARKSP